jgi:endonuclease/exonuclease/phosphatase (EEP) superfamily protein YafD
MLSSVLFLALAGSWLGSAGQFHWLPDLFSHFRLQYAMLSAAAAMVAVWQRQWLLLAVALATLSLNAWLLACQAWPQESGTAPDETPLQVISLNVLTSNPDKKRVLAYLTASAADVLFLMEIDADWAAALEPLKRSHPHHHLLPRPDNFGLALFSRLPLHGLRVFQPAQGPPVVQAKLLLQGRSLVFLGAHPPPPIGGRLSALRDAQLAALAEWTAGQDLPVLLAGDLNATPWSQALRPLTAAGFNSLHPAWPPTWRAGTIFALPIDHAFVTAPLQLQRRRTGPNLGSDHRPLEIEAGWR